MFGPTGTLVLSLLSLAIEPSATREIAFAPQVASARGTAVEMATVDLSREARPATPLSFSLDEYATVTIEVLDADGRLVRKLGSGLWAPGTHRLAWQRDDEAGERVSDGIYEIRVRHEVDADPLGR